ncbi:MAG: response regulator [Candidatus Omnitrophica bacterium]|nr:response regulator [Candidatus Omnitrophota bacterium]
MSKKILVVDDDPVVLKLVSSSLIKEGYEVVEVRDGLDAMRSITDDHPDMLVLDIMLPEINGYDICYNLRFDDKFPKLPVVIITSREHDLDEAIASRVNITVVQKPIDMKLLLEKIHLMLSL